MKNILTFFLALLLLALVFSCSNNNSGSSHQNQQDQILAAFPDLRIKGNSGNSSSTQNQFLYRQYYLNEGEKPYSGKLINDQWKDSLTAVGTFDNGKLQKFLSRYPNGNKRSVMEIRPANGDIPYQTKTWYYTGALQSKYDNVDGVRYFKNGNVQTEWNASTVTEYWKNGNRKMHRSLKDSTQTSILDGPFKAWHKNGHLSVKGTFTNGRKDGKWVHRNSAGQIEKVEFFDNGKRDSTITNP